MIILKKIRWKNFLSTGNTFTEVILDEAKTMLICGENGSGKSTVMDAITFALFNKPFRKINKPQLINSVNDKNCLVEIELESGHTKYLIRRGMKPGIFEIYKNGSMLDQEAANRDYQDIIEKRILGMNYKTFCQVVILGSANWTAFMSLRAHDRRKVIEDLLDIEIFSTMNTLLRSKMTDTKQKLDKINTRIAILDNTIRLNKEHAAAMRKNKEEEIARKREGILEQQETIDRLNKEAEEVNRDIRSLDKTIQEIDAVRRNIKETKATIDKTKSLQTQIHKDIKFYADNDTCPTCTQEIDSTFKHGILSQKNENLDKAKIVVDHLNQKIADYESTITHYDHTMASLQECTTKQSKLVTSISVANKLQQSLSREVEELQKDVAEHAITGDEEEMRNNAIKAKEILINRREVHNIAAILLKDNGIKTQIIRQYIPIMNTLINNYLERMEFFCNFSLDESFQEQIKSRHKDSFTYDSFSQGEKMRIDLALLFTWREISRMKNSSPVNLLLLDEIVDSSLDAAGTDEFLYIISQLTGENNVVIISHKADQIADKFDRVLSVNKRKNFSHYEEA